jgi:hypothetical protein
MLPNLIIIGAQKCGTSALHHYLQCHPDISMSTEKELNFFIEHRNWSNGVAWYESWFTGDARVHGEASPNYTNYPAVKGVPQRMHAIVPDAKLIYMVRHPLERIVSHYMHNRWSGLETRSITEALRGRHGGLAEDSRYIRRSKYFMQVAQFLEFFPQANIFITTQEELFKRRSETLRAVFRFLGIDDAFHSERFSTLVHESGEKKARNRLGRALAGGSERGILRRLPSVLRPPLEGAVRLLTTSRVERPVLDDRLRRQIIDVLTEDIEQFRRFAGRSFPEWSS